MSHRGTETTFELTTIERLEQLGYVHRFGGEIERPHDEVVLRDVLRANLARRYSTRSTSPDPFSGPFLAPMCGSLNHRGQSMPVTRDDVQASRL